ncbi:hypothetical protein AB0M38_10460 [Streptomyces sp. NPDC051742]|uniref:hypothetical protein n=1 Tax=unclassified Streptomyces TaxID=2593676 RepID=UPI00343C393F
MSAPHERPTLAPSLYAYAKGLCDSDPDAPPPQGGHPLPGTANPPGRRNLRHAEARAAVTAVLLPLLDAPDPVRAAAEAERALAATGVVRGQVVFHTAAAVEPPEEPAARARTRALARHLVRTGTIVTGVAAGLGLLSGLAEPEDVPYLRVLGLLDGLLDPVDRTLAPLDRESAALLWLIHRTRDEELRGLVEALAAGDRAAVSDRLQRLPTEARDMGPEASRRVADPGDPDVVETRFLIDGRPLVPEAFGLGPGESPERLLDSGALRAGPEPREVRLAEAYCTEGCCGALYVTVRRDGEHVVWSDWRWPGRPAELPDLPAYRFDADAYDAEIARAEHDHSWTWPARRTARLITAGLRDRPDLLTRWGLRQGWIGSDFGEPDTTVVTFTGPPLGDGGRSAAEGEPRQFLWRLPDDGAPPEERAATALRRLAEGDPRRYPELRG